MDAQLILRKQIGLDSKYGKILQATFNNAIPLETKFNLEIADWTTEQYAEYCAVNRVYSYKALSTFKSSIKEYIRLIGNNTDEIIDLTIDAVYGKVRDNKNIGVFWKNTRQLTQTIRNAYENVNRSVFVRNSVITMSLLLFCGLNYNEAMKLPRDRVTRSGIWTEYLPTKIQKNTMEAELVMSYARTAYDMTEEYYPNLPLVRGGKDGRKEFTELSYLTALRRMNSQQTSTPIYNITAQNIVLSGEFLRLYEKIGAVDKPETLMLEQISERDFVRLSPREIQYLYSLYCMLQG